MSALTSLQELWLSNMKVTGDINCLNAFTSLLCLDRRITQLQDDIGSLSALASLQKRGLFDTQVTGDFGSLSALANPQRLVLGLRKTKVVGDIGSVGARKVLDVMATPAMMTGAINSPSALMSLQAHYSVVKESAAGLEGPLSRTARLGI